MAPASAAERSRRSRTPLNKAQPHMLGALATGVRLGAIEALLAGDLDRLDDDARQLADYIRAILRGEVTDESYRGIQERFGDRGAVEYTVWVAFLQFLMRLLMA